MRVSEVLQLGQMYEASRDHAGIEEWFVSPILVSITQALADSIENDDKANPGAIWFLREASGGGSLKDWEADGPRSETDRIDLFSRAIELALKQGE